MGVCPCRTFGTSDRFFSLCGLLPPQSAPAPQVVTTWERAQQACQELGLELASIRSPEENESVILEWSIIQEGTAIHQASGIWIGLTDRLVEDRFIWSDGSRPGDFLWDDGEPNNGEGIGEHCGAILVEPLSRRSFWDDRVCDAEFHFLCQGP
jgi:hypothetical protein